MTEPKVGIGVPVYNGERFLRQALDSLLNQTLPDFEVLISDNGSSDSTSEICQEYASRDSRIRYVRQPANLGATANFNYLFRETRGTYFMWAAHDDLRNPDFLRRCVAALDQDPETVLVYSRARRIDEVGKVVGFYDKWDNNMRISHPAPHIRFSDVACVQHACLAIFGVMRRDVLARTRLLGTQVGADRDLLAELALLGKWRQLPDELFDRREHPGDSLHQFKREHLRLAWFDPGQAGSVVFPTWRSMREHFGSIQRAPLSRRERLLAYAQFPRWIFGPRWFRPRWLRILRDVGVGLAEYAKRSVRRSKT